MSGPGRSYACGCCTPPRAIYYRVGRPDTVHHEHAHTPAEAGPSKPEKRRTARDAPNDSPAYARA